LVAFRARLGGRYFTRVPPSRRPLRHVHAPADRAQHPRLLVLALRALANRSRLSALPAASRRKVPGLRAPARELEARHGRV